MTQIIPSSDRVVIQDRADRQQKLVQQEQEKIETELQEKYDEIEPFLTWLDEVDEETLVTQMGDPELVEQGLRGLLDDAQRKAMFAKMGGDKGGGKGIGKGSVGKAVGDAKKATKAAGVGKGVGTGVGNKKGVGAAVGKPGRVASFKAGTAKKMYNARMNHHAAQAPRDLVIAKHHASQVPIHKAKAAEYQATADYHHAESLSGANIIGSIAHVMMHPDEKDTQGSTGHITMRREAQAMADHHTDLAHQHSSDAKHAAEAAKAHTAKYRSMKRNNPYK